MNKTASASLAVAVSSFSLLLFLMLAAMLTKNGQPRLEFHIVLHCVLFIGFPVYLGLRNWK